MNFRRHLTAIVRQIVVTNDGTTHCCTQSKLTSRSSVFISVASTRIFGMVSEFLGAKVPFV
jgi:hypothetical protein